MCEETLSGKGTTHCTNGIAIQHQVYGPFKQPASQVLKSRRRSNTPRFSEVLPFNAGLRQGPPKMNVQPSLLSVPLAIHTLYIQEDFVCLLAHCSSKEGNILNVAMTTNQLIHGWSAFTAAVQKKSHQCVSSVISCCPVIGASPTRLDTVYTLLKRSVSMT